MNLKSNNFAVASLKTQRISASKARLVAVLLKGKKVSEALGLLANVSKKAAPIFTKLINSAVANAINNHGLSQPDLVIFAAIVNEGPTLKRFRPRAKGAASQILKRTSHFKVVLVDNSRLQEETTIAPNQIPFVAPTQPDSPKLETTIQENEVVINESQVENNVKSTKEPSEEVETNKKKAVK
ncbi:50S ribosomal protein L22 [Mycoplasma sp. 'Moose RK']|nr:50S ribosomal protein L22 [Mycoplasma sp. 'Moose RK']MBG0730824.1 50S ribosomal protein L22 [Mycoplasma sp. 'Moose RK']